MMHNRLHFSMAFLSALLLHGGLMAWSSLPVEDVLPESPPPLRLSLLAPVAEKIEAKVAISAPVLPKLPAEPVIEPKLVVEPEPVIEPELVVESEPVIEPEPMIEPELVVEPEPVIEPEPVTEEVAEVFPTPSPSENVLSEIAAPVSDPAAMAAYQKLLTAWLEKHKYYPRRARRLRIEGEGWLRIRIDRAGRAQDIRLERTSGNRLLDQAALEIARRADPFPVMPEKDARQELEFIVPLAFVLR